MPSFTSKSLASSEATSASVASSLIVSRSMGDAAAAAAAMPECAPPRPLLRSRGLGAWYCGIDALRESVRLCIWVGLAVARVGLLTGDVVGVVDVDSVWVVLVSGRSSSRCWRSDSCCSWRRRYFCRAKSRLCRGSSDAAIVICGIAFGVDLVGVWQGGRIRLGMAGWGLTVVGGVGVGVDTRRFSVYDLL